MNINFKHLNILLFVTTITMFLLTDNIKCQCYTLNPDNAKWDLSSYVNVDYEISININSIWPSFIDNAANSWNAVSPSVIDIFNTDPGGNSSFNSGFSFDGHCVVDIASWSVPLPLRVAFTAYIYDPYGFFIEVDIRYNSAFDFEVNGAANKYDVQSVAVHEFGHFAGLGDLSTPPCTTIHVMWHDLNPGEIKHTLQNGDKAGINSLYGGPTNINENTIYPQIEYLSQSYPNPFNPSTKINYTIRNNDNVHITVYNLNGQKIKTLVNEYKLSGSYGITWDGRNEWGRHVPSGTYFYDIRAGNFIDRKKMILIK